MLCESLCVCLNLTNNYNFVKSINTFRFSAIYNKRTIIL